MNIFDLTGKIALVTGGSTGIGYAMAKAMGQAGATLIIANRTASEGEAAAQQFQAEGMQASSFPVDIGKESSVCALFEHVEKKYKRLDILVNNAGINRFNSALDYTLEDWDAIMNVNLKGTFMCCQKAAPLMMPQNSGKIINLSSITAHKCLNNGSSLYSVTKAGISQLTKVLATEWSSYGICVNALAPGVVITRINEKKYEDQPDVLARVSAGIPLGRVSTTDEYMGVTLFLASSASDYMTGQTLYMDGGMSLV